MFGKKKDSVRDFSIADLREVVVKVFDKLDEGRGIRLDTVYPLGIWDVDGKDFGPDREAAEAYFQKLWEEENAKGNASKIKVWLGDRYG